MSFIAACFVFASQFLVVTVSTTEKLGKLDNNLSSLFSFKNRTAAEAAAMCAAKITFFMVY